MVIKTVVYASDQATQETYL